MATRPALGSPHTNGESLDLRLIDNRQHNVLFSFLVAAACHSLGSHVRGADGDRSVAMWFDWQFQIRNGGDRTAVIDSKRSNVLR